MHFDDVAEAVRALAGPLADLATDIPRLARAKAYTNSVDALLAQVPTEQRLVLGDARQMSAIASSSVHLVVTSPPYWTLKRYNEGDGQLGHVDDYGAFLAALDEVWRECLRVLVPGGRLVVVVGDVCLSRRQNKGRHVVVPLHASIAEHCRDLGFDGLAPIIWHKIANAVFEASGNGAGFLGKPYEPNAVIKNDIEYILMQRKPGGYRSPSIEARLLSLISEANHRIWFQQIWSDITGASTREHPAPFPIELAERLIRMFSFVGDTVLDPFVGSGTTLLAASRWGRDGVGFEIDQMYAASAQARLLREMTPTASLVIGTNDVGATAAA